MRSSGESLEALKKAGVRLGRRPALTEADCAMIVELHERGIGTVNIGRVVRTFNSKSGVWTNTTPKVIRKVLAGEYVPAEVWDLENKRAREAAGL